MKLLIAALSFAAMSWAADASGTWTGKVDMKHGGEVQTDTAYIILTQTGDEIKGSVGPNPEKQLPISKGKITGSDIVIEAAIPNKTDARMVLRLKLDGDKLTGTVRGEGAEAEEITGTLVLSRVK